MLLHEGVFPNIEPDCAPAAFLTQPEWIPLLEKAAETTSDHWHTWFQLGVMYCALPGFVDSKNEEKTERNAGDVYKRQLMC